MGKVCVSAVTGNTLCNQIFQHQQQVTAFLKAFIPSVKQTYKFSCDPGVFSSSLTRKQHTCNTKLYCENNGCWIEEPGSCKISHNCAPVPLSLKQKEETRHIETNAID